MKSKNIVLLTASLALGVCLLPLEGQASKTGGEKEEMGGSRITRKTPTKSEKKSGKTRKAITKRHEPRSGKGKKSNVRNKTKRQETRPRRDKNVEQVNNAPAPTLHNAKCPTPDEILQTLKSQQGAIAQKLSGKTELGLPTGLDTEKLSRLLGNKITKETNVGKIDTYSYNFEIDGYKAAFKIGLSAKTSLETALKEQDKSVFAVLYRFIIRGGQTEVPGAAKHVGDVVYLVVSKDKDGTLSHIKIMDLLGVMLSPFLKVQVSYYLKDQEQTTTTTLKNVQF